MGGWCMYDLIIIGGGPAGLSAGLYASRAQLKTLLIEKVMPGGLLGITEEIENYPGFPGGIAGFELGMKFHQQANEFGLQTAFEEVQSLKLEGNIKQVVTNQNRYESKAVIIATGTKYRQLKIQGEQELLGKGVSYCATCDGAFFKDKEVVVIGGGDAAVEEALFLTRFASKVTIVHRRDSLRATMVLQERAKANEKINFLWNSAVERIVGQNQVEGVQINNLASGDSHLFKAQGVFIFIGLDPVVDLFKNQVDLTPEGYILADETTKTSIPGVFAAGDIRKKPLRQVVTAVSDGAVAAVAAEKYLEQFE